jgi:hypothetical protein
MAMTRNVIAEGTASLRTTSTTTWTSMKTPEANSI